MATYPREGEYMIDEAGEIDFSDPRSDDFAALSRDRIPIRSLLPADLAMVVDIDRRTMGRMRQTYYERMFHQVFEVSGVRVSLVAELDGRIVGFVMARVDYGEFGRAEPVAVMDAIGVHPDYRHQDIATALMSQILVNLKALQVERIRTSVAWRNVGLLGFLADAGFRPAQRLALSRPLPAWPE